MLVFNFADNKDSISTCCTSESLWKDVVKFNFSLTPHISRILTI